MKISKMKYVFCHYYHSDFISYCFMRVTQFFYKVLSQKNLCQSFSYSWVLKMEVVSFNNCYNCTMHSEISWSLILHWLYVWSQCTWHDICFSVISRHIIPLSRHIKAYNIIIKAIETYCTQLNQEYLLVCWCALNGYPVYPFRVNQ